MQHRAFLTIALIAISTVAASSAANATFSLPAADGLVLADSYYSGTLQYGVSASVRLSDPYGGWESASVSGTPIPFAMASAKSGQTGLYNFAQSALSYYTEVLGAPNTMVPVYIQGTVSTRTNSINGFGDVSSATVDLLNGSNYLFDVSISSAWYNPIQNRTFNQLVMIPSDTPIYVYLTTFASDAAGTSSAKADPFLFIDPNFAGANQYSLAFSNGITNSPVSAVPLPASFPMFASLIAGMAGFAYCRNRRSFALAAR